MLPSAEGCDEEEVEGVEESATYLLERRSMLLSGRQKLERSVQVSDMLTHTRHHHQDTGGDSERASAASTLSLSLSLHSAPSLSDLFAQ